jgi:hypothetical protein
MNEQIGKYKRINKTEAFKLLSSGNIVIIKPINNNPEILEHIITRISKNTVLTKMNKSYFEKNVFNNFVNYLLNAYNCNQLAYYQIMDRPCYTN